MKAKKDLLTIAIPTLDRGPIILETLSVLLGDRHASEILVVDQSVAYPKEIEAQLSAWHESWAIRWLRLPEPSIPRAMNVGLREASGDIVLFLDDDIRPGKDLGDRHLANYEEADVVAVAGQVIQPWQSPADMPRPRPRTGIWEDLDFPFYSTARADVRNCIACNFSVRRDAALDIGGFDENFIGAAYRFETEFCRRLTRRGGRVVFDPQATVRHLKAESGGTRTFGDGVKGGRIEHSVGNYYFAFLETSGLEFLAFSLKSIVSTTLSKYYARHPWKIPSHIYCQIAGIELARRLYHEKRRRPKAAGRKLAGNRAPPQVADD